jgi:hypothetical protein
MIIPQQLKKKYRLLKKRLSNEIRLKKQYKDKCYKLEQKVINLIETTKFKNKEPSQNEKKNENDVENCITLMNMDDEFPNHTLTTKSENVLINKNIDILEKDFCEYTTQLILKEKEEIKNQNLILTKEINDYKKVNQIYIEQIMSFVDEIRKQTTLNLEIKKLFDELKKENETLSKELNHMKLTLKVKMEKIADYEKQIGTSLKRESEFKSQIDLLNEKVVNPHQQAYIYKGWLLKQNERKEIIIIFRKNLMGELLIECELDNKDIFYLKLKNILKVERNLNNKNIVKIIKRNLFQDSLLLEFEKESTFYNDFKKFWFIYMSDSKLISKSKSLPPDDIFGSLKKLVFN